MSLGNSPSAVQKMCEEHMNYKSHLHKTCVSMCAKVWDAKRIWEVWLDVLSPSSVWMWMYSCVYTHKRCPVSSPRVDSFYLRRTPDKHIRMYLCCPGLCSQNCTISFTVLLNRLCETVICTQRGEKQSIKRGLAVAFKRLTEFYVPLQNVNKCAFFSNKQQNTTVEL